MADYARGLLCLRCRKPFQGGWPFEGCPSCRTDRIAVNLTVDYHYDRLRHELDWASLSWGVKSLWRYKPLLPVQGPEISLNEGLTPLVEAPRLAARWQIGRLLVKDESRNPTASFKDRMASVVVSRAVQEGATVVALASSGNGGAALAAYAARAGIRCVILALAHSPRTMLAQIASYGASIVAFEHPRDRWTLMAEGVRRFGWYPAGNYVFPPVGSNPYGIEGYKTIAYEIFEELGGTPDYVVVPTCYADGLWGITKGFLELVDLGISARTPRMVAAEVFGSLRSSLAAGSDTAIEVPTERSLAISIATGISTYQGIAALRTTGGEAISIYDRDMLQARQELAESEGMLAEVSSAASLAAARRLGADGKLRDSTVVCVVTSSGLKDTELVSPEHIEIPTLPKADMATMSQVLKERYGLEV